MLKYYFHETIEDPEITTLLLFSFVQLGKFFGKKAMGE